MNECRECGKCCDLNTFNLHVYPLDVRRWQSKGQSSILRQLCFGVDTKKNQIWTFQKQPDGHCYFHRNGHCSIYKSRPLTCQIYPLTHANECLNHVLFPGVDKHTFNLWKRAMKEFSRAGDDWMQQKLIAILHVYNDMPLVKREDIERVNSIEA